MCISVVLVNCNGSTITNSQVYPSEIITPQTHSPNPSPTAETRIAESQTPHLPTPDPSPTLPVIDDTPAPTPTTNPPSIDDAVPTITYYSQSGDSLGAVASHFNVSPEEITSPLAIPEKEFIKTGQVLYIPDTLDVITTFPITLLPDSEVVFSRSASDFDIKSYLKDTTGYLKSYRELMGDGWYTGAEIVERLALNHSINPYLLITVLEYQSHWVSQKPTTNPEAKYPMGLIDQEKKGLFHQLKWAAQQLKVGYYGWRYGTLTELVFLDGTKLHLAPELNAGTVALQYFLSRSYNYDEWFNALYSEESVLELHEELFGNYWARAGTVEPLIPGPIRQPALELPLYFGSTWNLTGGPHPAWGDEGTFAALDFAPTGTKDCSRPNVWVLSASNGLVSRAWNALVVVDIDMDGDEHTGWVLIYQHIAESIYQYNPPRDKVKAGEIVHTGGFIGYPSCVGGFASGTHLHFARRFNGEWIPAVEQAPFILSGWSVETGNESYQGMLIKDDMIIEASSYSERKSLIESQN